jgi:hypothetical protein
MRTSPFSVGSYSGETDRSQPIRATMPATSTNATTAATFNGVGPILLRIVGHPPRGRYTYAMADEAVLDEIQENTKEAGLRLRASLTLLHSQGMIDESDYRELVSCLRTSLAMVEAAYMEARRRG